VSLKSASPFDKPLINPNYLANPNDMKVLVRGVRLALRIGRARALEPVFRLKDHYEDKNNDLWLGDADPDKITDDEIIEHIRADASSMYHPTCTCKMGQDEKQSVVGPDLRVHGVNGLRIADASIFPEQISAHPVCECAVSCYTPT
jgi:choline dehydrogenase